MPRNLEKTIISVLLAALVPIMLLAAASRHLAPHYHPDILAAAAACLAWLSSFGIAHAAAVDAHIQIPILKTVVSPGNRRRLQAVADTAFLLFSAASLVIGVIVLHRSLTQSGLPGHPLVYASIPVGSVLTIYRLLQRLGGGRRA